MAYATEYGGSALDTPDAGDENHDAMTNLPALVIIIFSVTFGTRPLPQSSSDAALDVAEVVARARCGAQIRVWLTEQQARPLATTRLLAAPEATYRMPTSGFGRWIVLQTDGYRELRAARVVASEVRRVRWDADCAPAVDTGSGPFDADTIETGFTDDDLHARLDAGGRGVIYLWSPHMPFSVEGVASISAAAQRRSLELIIVLDPASDSNYARETASSSKLPESGLRPLAAVELLFRGITNHAPSIQLYGNGRLIGPMLPGVRSAEGYLEFFDSFAHDLAR